MWIVQNNIDKFSEDPQRSTSEMNDEYWFFSSHRSISFSPLRRVVHARRRKNRNTINWTCYATLCATTSRPLSIKSVVQAAIWELCAKENLEPFKIKERRIGLWSRSEFRIFWDLHSSPLIVGFNFVDWSLDSELLCKQIINFAMVMISMANDGFHLLQASLTESVDGGTMASTLASFPTFSCERVSD